MLYHKKYPYNFFEILLAIFTKIKIKKNCTLGLARKRPTSKCSCLVSEPFFKTYDLVFFCKIQPVKALKQMCWMKYFWWHSEVCQLLKKGLFKIVSKWVK